MRPAARLILVAALPVGVNSGMFPTQPRTWRGAAIGGGTGLPGGYVYDQYEQSQGRP